ncbi:hypothetical protein VFPPC_15500 [Pochonia chlamydosporia 170]|uniref:Uncharacterized protein n=1 Tax=Pochonia chlamydosporia 170 TaxID=1380566 RepID=A0A179FWY1_METCM|nr:hypothetical protein VFPPC_15500 [Pochonia chlamydosporia 170]OAQ69867.1 hypothetical protein VFPPC_15500 [Pochonia chlamydosporia 170]
MPKLANHLCGHFSHFSLRKGQCCLVGAGKKEGSGRVGASFLPSFRWVLDFRCLAPSLALTRNCPVLSPWLESALAAASCAMSSHNKLHSSLVCLGNAGHELTSGAMRSQNSMPITGNGTREGHLTSATDHREAKQKATIRREATDLVLSATIDWSDYIGNHQRTSFPGTSRLLLVFY